MATSTIPAALDNLIALCRANTQLKAITIVDGQPTTDLPGNYLLIGFADELGASVSGSQVPASLGNLRRQESYQINCEVSCWTGSAVMKTVRDSAFSILGHVEDVVRTNATLGDTVIFSDFGQRMEFEQVQTQQGAVATIKFDITVKFSRI